ncbi:unnamed protein product, partial [Hapterophycus canaliculatus]
MKCIFCSQETYIWKYGMADHVTRCHIEDALVQEGTEVATNFRRAYTVLDSEKAMVLGRFRGGSPRRRRSDAPSPGVLAGLPGTRAPSLGAPSSWPSEEEKGKEKREEEGEEGEEGSGEDEGEDEEGEE